MNLRHILASLLFTAACTLPAVVFAQQADAPQDAPYDEKAIWEESDYQSPSFMTDDELAPQNLPVQGTSEYTFNPVTGLYEHTPSQAKAEQGDEDTAAGTDGKYRGPMVDQTDIDPYLESGGIEDGYENSRGIRNVTRKSDSKRANVDAYREMMGLDPEEDISADNQKIDRSYLKRNNRYDSRGISSSRYVDSYDDEEQYYEEELFDRLGNRVMRGDNRRGSEPKTGNRDAYREMMDEIEGR